MQPIPFNDLSRAVVAQQSALQEAANRVIESGWFVLGREVSAFESEFAAYCGVPHCISVANGSDALALALAAVGVAPGDKVVTCANAAMYSTLAILSLQAEPVFVDTANDHTMNPEEFKRVAELHGAAAAIKAVVVTHLYGQLADIEAIVAIAKVYGIRVVEDCAQAHGATRSGKRAGSFGDVATFSFYPTKNLGALGDGGAVVCTSDAIKNKLLKLRQYGWGTKYFVEVSGGRNSRLDEMQAAFLRVRLPMLEEANTRRRAIARRYATGIKHASITLPTTLDESYVAHLFVVQTNNMESLMKHLRNQQIKSDIHYPLCDHWQPVMKAQYGHISLPKSERAAKEVLSLPCFPELTNDEVDTVIAAVNSWKQR